MDHHIALINSCVHIIMYSYYFLGSFRELIGVTKPLKPFITSIQLMQLVVILGQTVAALAPSCGATKLFYLQAVNAAILIYFFAEFYIQSYMKKKQN
jgi:hypothetical protein